MEDRNVEDEPKPHYRSMYFVEYNMRMLDPSDKNDREIMKLAGALTLHE